MSVLAGYDQLAPEKLSLGGGRILQHDISEGRKYDINDRPTEILLSDTAIAENQGAGVLVGTFTSTDDDTDDKHLYTFTGTSTGNNDNDLQGEDQGRGSCSSNFPGTITYKILRYRHPYFQWVRHRRLFLPLVTPSVHCAQTRR